jgi:hypothetical protein
MIFCCSTHWRCGPREAACHRSCHADAQYWAARLHIVSRRNETSQQSTSEDWAGLDFDLLIRSHILARRGEQSPHAGHLELSNLSLPSFVAHRKGAWHFQLLKGSITSMIPSVANGEWLEVGSSVRAGQSAKGPIPSITSRMRAPFSTSQNGRRRYLDPS